SSKLFTLNSIWFGRSPSAFAAAPCNRTCVTVVPAIFFSAAASRSALGWAWARCASVRGISARDAGFSAWRGSGSEVMQGVGDGGAGGGRGRRAEPLCVPGAAGGGGTPGCAGRRRWHRPRPGRAGGRRCARGGARVAGAITGGVGRVGAAGDQRGREREEEGA